jgi:hypothetical protein
MRQTYSLAAVRGFANHLEVRVDFQKRAQPLAYYSVVVRDEDVYWHSRLSDS